MILSIPSVLIDKNQQRANDLTELWYNTRQNISVIQQNAIGWSETFLRKQFPQIKPEETTRLIKKLTFFLPSNNYYAHGIVYLVYISNDRAKWI